MLNPTELQNDLIDKADQFAELVRDGRITSFAICFCLDNGWGNVIAGTQAADLNLCLDDCKDKILTEVISGNTKAKAKPTKSSILRVS